MFIKGTFLDYLHENMPDPSTRNGDTSAYLLPPQLLSPREPHAPSGPTDGQLHRSINTHWDSLRINVHHTRMLIFQGFLFFFLFFFKFVLLLHFLGVEGLPDLSPGAKNHTEMVGLVSCCVRKGQLA